MIILTQSTGIIVHCSNHTYTHVSIHKDTEKILLACNMIWSINQEIKCDICQKRQHCMEWNAETVLQKYVAMKFLIIFKNTHTKLFRMYVKTTRSNQCVIHTHMKEFITCAKSYLLHIRWLTVCAVYWTHRERFKVITLLVILSLTFFE